MSSNWHSNGWQSSASAEQKWHNGYQQRRGGYDEADDDDEDWDLCYEVKKGRKCTNAHCRWRHDPPSWMKSSAPASGSSSSRGAGGGGASSSSSYSGSVAGRHANHTQKLISINTSRWWQETLAGESCPISLVSMEELAHEPFGLIGSSDGSSQSPNMGVWGNAKECEKYRSSGAVVHWFDGAFLASFLVSSGQFIDPVNRRPLSLGECMSLDAYIAAHKFPAVHVADAFELSRKVASKQQTGNENGDNNSTANTALQREAAAILRNLFSFRSATAEQPERVSSRIGPRTGLQQEAPLAQMVSTAGTGASLADQHQEALTAGVQPAIRARRWQAQAQAAQQTVSQQRTVHEEGGLRVVDDNEFDEPPPLTAPPSDGLDAEAEPTPAEALAMGQAPASKPKLKPLRQPTTRPRQQGGEAQTCHVGRGGGGGGGGGERVTVALTERQQRLTGGSSSSATAATAAAASQKPLPRVDEDWGKASTSASAASAAVLQEDVWVPDWATYELHERTLDEVSVLEAMFMDDVRIDNTAVKAHLETCVAERRVSTRQEALEVEVSLEVGGGAGGGEGGGSIVVSFALPPFYPIHLAAISLREQDPEEEVQSASVMGRVLLALQETVLPKHEGSEILMPVLEFLTHQGPAALAKARKQQAEASAAPQAAAGAVQPDGSQGGADEKSKRERVEDAKKERLATKFTTSWDLCYAFVKHGKCKDGKNCPWRHDQPAKKGAGGEAAAASAAVQEGGASKSGKEQKKKKP